jgi:hypothetical protein
VGMRWCGQSEAPNQGLISSDRPAGHSPQREFRTAEMSERCGMICQCADRARRPTRVSPALISPGMETRREARTAEINSEAFDRSGYNSAILTGCSMRDTGERESSTGPRRVRVKSGPRDPRWIPCWSWAQSGGTAKTVTSAKAVTLRGPKVHFETEHGCSGELVGTIICTQRVYGAGESWAGRGEEACTVGRSSRVLERG